MLNRREILITHMENLESQGKGCLGCAGNCCTFEANSMLLTPLEAYEIFDYLEKNNLLTSELKSRLQETVSKYKLEPKFEKVRSYLRKTYTCPFFTAKELGCPLPRDIKPYGCLAFNSHHETLKASSDHCYSEKELLKERETLHANENDFNEEIKTKFNLIWEKSPIPNALLEIWSKR